jgi:hypothetical protein
MHTIESTPKNLRQFGIIMGTAFLVIAGLVFLKHRQVCLPLATISLVFFTSAFVAAAVLKPFYIIWMRFAYIVSWINTRIILCVIFYVIFTPIGLIMRLLRRDLLERAVDRKRVSYWIEREKRECRKADYERQF